jgi:hypothetical protein
MRSSNRVANAAFARKICSAGDHRQRIGRPAAVILARLTGFGNNKTWCADIAITAAVIPAPCVDLCHTRCVACRRC